MKTIKFEKSGHICIIVPESAVRSIVVQQKQACAAIQLGIGDARVWIDETRLYESDFRKLSIHDRAVKLTDSIYSNTAWTIPITALAVVDETSPRSTKDSSSGNLPTPPTATPPEVK